MGQSWQLDRHRLLGARAEVMGPPDPVLGTRAEPRPGEVLSFSSLSYAPEDDPIVGALWLACLPQSGGEQGCEFDGSAFEDLEDLDESATPEEIEEVFERVKEAGIIGVEPDWPPMWEVPADVLDNVEDKLEGLSAMVNISLLPETEDMPEDVEAGFKRIAVSEATSPNHNPEITDITVAGVALDGARGFTARAGYTYILEPIVPEGHVETYSYLNTGGEEEWRVEEPYFTWYTEPGADKPNKQARFKQEYSLHPNSSVEWTAPKKPGQVEIYVVVRDRRGGMGWRTLLVNVL
jgi:hypothetical protein